MKNYFAFFGSAKQKRSDAELAGWDARPDLVIRYVAPLLTSDAYLFEMNIKRP